MANLPLLSISGRIQQLPSGSVLEVQQAAGLDTDQAGSLLLGASTATSIDIGSVGVLTTIKGDLRIDGTETVIGNSTFESDADFQGNITLGDAAADTLTINATTDYAAGNVTATGNPTWNFGSGQADFDGNLDANQGLDVTGATTLTGQVDQIGGAQVTLSGNLDADGGLDVTGATTMAGALTQTGGAQVTLSGNVDAQDGVDITGGDFLFTATDGSVFRITEADATMTQTGTAQVTLGGNLDADGGLDVSGADFTMTDATGGAFTIAQATGAITQSTAAQVTLAGNLDADGGLDVTGASTHQGGDYTFTDATGATIVFDNATGGITQSALGANTLAGDTTVTGNFYSSTYAQASGSGLYVDGGVLAAINSTSFLGYTFDVSGTNPSMTQSGSGVNYFSGQISAGLTVVRDGYSILMINSGGDIADFQHAGDALILNQQPDKAPQVTQTTNASIAAPTNGMIIYDTGTSQMLGYINGSWTDMGSAVESVAQVVASGIDTSALSVGELGYYSANKTLAAADNSGASSSVFGGVCKTSDASGEAIVSGVAPMAFTAAPSAGDLVYMDGGLVNAGNATTTAPSAAGEYVAELGVCMTSAADGDGNYDVMLAVKATVEIS